MYFQFFEFITLCWPKYFVLKRDSSSCDLHKVTCYAAQCTDLPLKSIPNNILTYHKVAML